MTGYSFTDDVRHALERAREEAAALQHAQVVPEHLLLGLTRRPGDMFAAVLKDLRADPHDLSRRMAAAATSPVVSDPPGPDFPYTMPAKRVLELAMVEARELN
jgi:ATP-dependent Clp protease ATP-binding subunit ClpA